MENFARRCQAKFLTFEISDFTPSHARSNIIHIKYYECNVICGVITSVRRGATVP